MSFIWLLIFGALVGWLATLITRSDKEHGAVANIVIGIVGSFLGGWLFRLMGFTDGYFGPGNIIGQLVSGLVGAVLLLVLYNAVRGKRTDFIGSEHLRRR